MSALFDELAGAYLGRDGVTYGQIWHNDGMKVNDKIFAMMVGEQLVVKLPAAQATALFDARDGVAYEPRPGRKMREWVVVGSADRARWQELIADAYAYGAALTGKGT